MLAAHHAVVDASETHQPDFSGNDDALASNIEVLKSLTQLDLSFTHSVTFRSVKEVDAEVEALFDSASGEIES